MNKKTRHLSWLHMTLLAVTLGAVLAFLNSRMQAYDRSDYLENATLLQRLKQLNTNWELGVLQAKTGLSLNYDALANSLVRLNMLVQQLQTSIAARQHEQADILARSIKALRDSIETKTALVEHFKSHNSVLRNSLVFLPTAAADVQASLDHAPEVDRKTGRRISESVNKILVASMAHSQIGATAESADISPELLALEAERHLPTEVERKLAVFVLHVRTLLREQQLIDELLGGIAAVPTTERIDDIGGALNGEQQQAAGRASRYRQYLMLFSAGLISLLLYAATRLVRSHTVINRTAAELREANEGLEHHVQERTQELANSIALLNATLESSTDGILAYRYGGGMICCNSRYQEMWQLPTELALTNMEDEERIQWIAQQLRDPEKFLSRHRELKARGETDAFDVIELKDGRTFERYIKPQRLDNEVVGVVVSFRDITERKLAEQELKNVHRQLLESSRQAGMAEVATGVLHNVGNVLNSVNVSTNLIIENARKSKISNLHKVSSLLHEHEADLANFIAYDPKGRHLPAYIAQLSHHLSAERNALMHEAESLRGNIDHIKQIVSMQQSYSKVSGAKEMVDVVDLLEDALRINKDFSQRHSVEIVRDFDTVPALNVERHQVLQILVNLVRNAHYACSESGRTDKRITLLVAGGNDSVRISVSDNGVGIAPENLTRIFGHGFTTRKDGHGFGLHSGALVARELGGSLRAHSDGLGLGAQFTLELPLMREAAYA